MTISPWRGHRRSPAAGAVIAAALTLVLVPMPALAATGSPEPSAVPSSVPTPVLGPATTSVLTTTSAPVASATTAPASPAGLASPLTPVPVVMPRADHLVWFLEPGTSGPRPERLELLSADVDADGVRDTLVYRLDGATAVPRPPLPAGVTVTPEPPSAPAGGTTPSAPVTPAPDAAPSAVPSAPAASASTATATIVPRPMASASPAGAPSGTRLSAPVLAPAPWPQPGPAPASPAPGSAVPVRWILAHSHPAVPVAQVLAAASVDATTLRGVPVEEQAQLVIQATQAAIYTATTAWRLDPGRPYATADSGFRGDPAALSTAFSQVYAHLITQAQGAVHDAAGPDPALTLLAPTAPGKAGGLVGPLRVSAPAGTVTVQAATAAGATLVSAPGVPLRSSTLAPASLLYAQVAPSAPAGQLRLAVTASAPTLALGTLLAPAGGTASLAVARTAPVATRATATATLRWAAAPPRPVPAPSGPRPASVPARRAAPLTLTQDVVDQLDGDKSVMSGGLLRVTLRARNVPALPAGQEYTVRLQAYDQPTGTAIGTLSTGRCTAQRLAIGCEISMQAPAEAATRTVIVGSTVLGPSGAAVVQYRDLADRANAITVDGVPPPGYTFTPRSGPTGPTISDRPGLSTSWDPAPLPVPEPQAAATPATTLTPAGPGLPRTGVAVLQAAMLALVLLTAGALALLASRRCGPRARPGPGAEPAPHRVIP